MSAELPTLFSEATSGEKRIRANGTRQLSLLLECASGDIGRLIGESARSSGRMGSICDTLVWELEAAERDADQVQRLLLILGKLACDDVDSEAQATRYSLRGRKLEAWLVRCVADDAALRTRYLAAAALQDMCSDHVLASAAVDAGAVAALQQAVRKSAAAAASARRGDDAELMYRFAAGALNAILRARPHKTSLADRPSRTSPPPVGTSAKTMSVADHGAGTELSRNTPHVTPSCTASRSEDSLPAVSCSPRPAMPPSRGSSSRPMSGSASLPSLPMANRPRSGLAGGRPVHQQMAFRASDLHCASRPASPPRDSGSLAAADCGSLCSTSAGSGVSSPLSRSPSRKPSASRQGRPGQPASVCPQLSYDEMVELLELAVTAGDESLIAEALATAARAGINLDQLEADLELKQSFIFSPRPPTSDAEQHRRAADKAAVEADERKAARVRQHAEDKAIVDAAEAAPAVAAAAAAGAKAETVVLPGGTNPEEAAMETAEAMAAAAAAAKGAADEVCRVAFARAHAEDKAIVDAAEAAPAVAAAAAAGAKAETVVLPGGTNPEEAAMETAEAMAAAAAAAKGAADEVCRVAFARAHAEDKAIVDAAEAAPAVAAAAAAEAKAETVVLPGATNPEEAAMETAEAMAAAAAAAKGAADEVCRAAFARAHAEDKAIVDAAEAAPAVAAAAAAGAKAETVLLPGGTNPEEAAMETAEAMAAAAAAAKGAADEVCRVAFARAHAEDKAIVDAAEAAPAVAAAAAAGAKAETVLLPGGTNPEEAAMETAEAMAAAAAAAKGAADEVCRAAFARAHAEDKAIVDAAEAAPAVAAAAAAEAKAETVVLPGATNPEEAAMETAEAMAAAAAAAKGAADEVCRAAFARAHAEDKAIVDAAEAAPAVAAAAAAGAKAETVVLPGGTNPEEAAMETAEAMAAAAAAAKGAADEVRRAAFARAAQAVQASVRKVQAARAADVERAARAQEKARQEAIEHDPAPSLADGIVSTMLQKLGAEADATACELAESMVQGIIARALGRSFMSLAKATREALRAAAAEPLPAADDITTVVQAKEIAGALQAQSTAQAAEMAALEAALESLRGQHPAVYPGLHRPGLRSLDDLWGNASSPGSPEEHDELGQPDFSYEAALARMAERHAREAAIRVRKSAEQIQEKIHRARAHLHELRSLNQEQERDREREMRRWERQMATYCLSETLDQARERVRALRANQLRLEEQVCSDAAERAKKLVKRRAERMSDAAALQAAKYRMELAELNRHAGDVHSQRASGLESRRKDALKSASTLLESKLQEQAQAQRQINAIRRVRLPPLQVPTIEERLTAALGKGLNLETHAGGVPPEEREARRPGLAKAIRQLTLSPDAGRGSTGPRRRVFCAPPQPTVYRDAVMRSSKSVGALPALKQLGRRPRHAQRAPERPPPKASTMPASPQEGEMASRQGDNNDDFIPLYLTEPGGLDMLFGCHTLVKQPPSAGDCTSRSETVDRHGRRRDSV